MPVFFMRSPDSPLISIIIPSRDGQAHGNVKLLLASLARQQRIEEAEILLVVGERPNGHARNVGVEASHGRWLVFIDDDAGLGGTDFLIRLLAPLETGEGGKDIGMTGVSTCLPDGASWFQRLQARSLPRTVFPEVKTITDSDMAHHLCCALPRVVYEAVGRESDHLETGTDLDLRTRLHEGGYRVVVVPGAPASHPPPANLLAFWLKHFWYGTGKVELDRLHPGGSRDRIGHGRLAWCRYFFWALLTFPCRTVRLDRASQWRWRPLLALADLARKAGYVRAFRRDQKGLPPTGRTRWFSSEALADWLSRTTRRAPGAPHPAEVKRLLVIQTAGMGDALAMFPFLGALRRHFAGAEITGWVSRRGAARALELSGAMDGVIRWDLAGRHLWRRLYRKARLLLWLRRRRFDLAVVNYINSNAEMALLLRLGGVPCTAGYESGTPRQRRFNLAVPLLSPFNHRPANLRHLDLLPVLGLSQETETAPALKISPAARLAAESHLAKLGGGPQGGSRIIGLHPGCGAGMAWKRWPAGRFAQLGDRLAAAGFRIWVFGGPDETSLVRSVLEQMRHPALDLSGEIDLEVAGALMETCALMVCNDSGLYNLALCLPLPVVVLFGPTLTTLSGPWPRPQRGVAVQVDLPCRPCVDLLAPPAELSCPVDRACLTSITVDAVLEACQGVLEGRPSGPSLAADVAAAAGRPDVRLEEAATPQRRR